MEDFKIGKFEYRAGKIDAWTQLHVVRRLFPILTNLAKAIRESKTKIAQQLATDESDMTLVGMEAIASAIADMKDEDLDYVLKACLKVCHRKQDDKYYSMCPQGQLMFQDIHMPDLLQLTSAVLQRQEGLVDFFQKLQSGEAPVV